MIRTRPLFALVAVVCISFGLMKDFLFGGESGIGFHQLVIVAYGLTVMVAVGLADRKTCLRAGLFQVFVIFLGGVGIVIALLLDYVIDPHWIYFAPARNLILSLMFVLVFIAVFHSNYPFALWLSRASLFLACSIVGVTLIIVAYFNVRIPYPYLWGSFVAATLSFMTFTVLKESRRVRPVSFNLMFLFLTLFIAETFFTADFWVRVGSSNPPPRTEVQSDKGFVTIDGAIGFVPKPDNTVVYREYYLDGTSLESVYTINKNGLRDCKREVIGGEKVLVFFGGSFTFGEGVNDDETIPCQVVGRASSYRAYNFGFNSYGPHQFLAQLLDHRVEKIVRGEPEYFVYNMIPHHVYRVVSPTFGVGDLGGFQPRFEIVEGSIRRLGFFNTPDTLWGKMRPYFMESALFRRVIPHIEYATSDLEGLFITIVLKIDEIRKIQYPDSKFIIVYWDLLGTGPAPNYSNHFSTISRQLSNHGIRHIKVSQMLPMPQSETRYLLKHNGHPNAEAYAKIAEYLVTEVF